MWNIWIYAWVVNNNVQGLSEVFRLLSHLVLWQHHLGNFDRPGAHMSSLDVRTCNWYGSLRNFSFFVLCVLAILSTVTKNKLRIYVIKVWVVGKYLHALSLAVKSSTSLAFLCDFSRMCVWVCVCWLYIFVKMENKLFCRLKLVKRQTANISFFRVPNLTTLVSCERFTYLGEKKKRWKV